VNRTPFATIALGMVVLVSITWAGWSPLPSAWYGIAAFTFMLWLDIKFMNMALTASAEGAK